MTQESRAKIQEARDALNEKLRKSIPSLCGIGHGIGLSEGIELLDAILAAEPDEPGAEKVGRYFCAAMPCSPSDCGEVPCQYLLQAVANRNVNLETTPNECLTCGRQCPNDCPQDKQPTVSKPVQELARKIHQSAMEISEEWECDDSRLDDPEELRKLDEAVDADTARHIQSFLNAQIAERDKRIAELESALDNANGVLRSAYSIASRNGSNVASWEGFMNRIDEVLKEEHILLQTYWKPLPEAPHERSL